MQKGFVQGRIRVKENEIEKNLIWEFIYKIWEEEIERQLGKCKCQWDFNVI